MPAITKRQLHPVAQIVLDDPRHRPEQLLDPLCYQTGRARTVTVSATSNLLPPRDNRLATVAAWIDWHQLHIISAEQTISTRYRVILGTLQ